jgi:hypothetical protein
MWDGAHHFYDSHKLLFSSRQFVRIVSRSSWVCYPPGGINHVSACPFPTRQITYFVSRGEHRGVSPSTCHFWVACTCPFPRQVSRSSALDALHITCRVFIAWNDIAPQMPFTYSKVAYQLHRAHIHFSIGLPHELETPHSSVWSNVAEGLTHAHMSSSMSSVCTSLDDLSPDSGSA